MDILTEIIAYKKNFVIALKNKISINDFKKSIFFDKPCISLKQKLANQNFGIIAELKRKSPSKGWLHQNLDFKVVAKNYEKSGAVAISVLTDEKYFGGKNEYLEKVRKTIKLPILRKDFIVDEFQIYEAKAIGADLILLIAATLTIKQCLAFAQLAKQLNLEVLLEINNEKEIAQINKFVDFVGVNNRNLKTFEVDIKNSVKLAQKIPNDILKISESGISNEHQIKKLRENGFKAFLIGEHFMKSENAGLACKNLIAKVNFLEE